MKTSVKILLGIGGFFGTIAGWHAAAPLSWCWLTEAQLGACVCCAVIPVLIAIPVYFETR